MKNQIDLLIITYACIAVPFLSSCNKKSSGLPEVETQILSAVTQNTAVSGGKIISDGGSEITAKGVCWGTNTNPTLSDSQTIDGMGDTDFISTLSELTPKTDYHVRAYSTNNEGTSYGDDKSFRTLSTVAAGQIIADHTVVDKFNTIPQYYIDKVKEMWLVYAGESHSESIRRGLELLETSNPKFQVEVAEWTNPVPYTSSYLRADANTWGDLDHATGWIRWYGEEDWYTSSAAVSRTKAGIKYCNTTGPALSAIGFGLCYGDGGGNYITATQEYVNYCIANNYPTKVFFTTGPVDVEIHAYEWYLNYETIRNHVAADETLILFDFADILCYDNGSETPNTIIDEGHSVPHITDKNLSPDTGGFHFSNAGAIRLSKAMWWMLARIEGWDGN